MARPRWITQTQQEWLEQRLLQPFNDQCVEWPFILTDKDGYATVRWNTRRRRVSHLVLPAFGYVRPEPPNNDALHSCNNPPCINPNHLRWGSNQENIAQRNKENRQNKGETVNTSRLKEIDIHVIFALDRLGFYQYEIGDMFDVHQGRISSVLTGQTWKHVNLGHSFSFDGKSFPKD